MGENSQQIAEDMQRIEKALGALAQDLAEHPMDCEHVRTRLTDFSTVLSALRQRVLSLPNEQLQPEENTENES